MRTERASTFTRRRFIGCAGAAALLAACRSVTEADADPSRIIVNAATPTQPAAPGHHVLVNSLGQRAELRIPAAYQASEALPLIVAFHGAGGRGDDFVNYAQLADDARIVFLAPSSIGGTWDAITGPFGADARFVSGAIAGAIDSCRIDTSRIAFMGFSDGASYALSLGLRNGDLVRSVIAHSPGFYLDTPLLGTPSFFITHGRNDDVLGIDQASRVIVPKLRALGDTVRYVEFDGGHELPLPLEAQAIQWLTMERFAR